MSPAKLAPLVALSLFFISSPARAQGEVLPVLGLFIVAEGAVVIAGTVTGIGTGIQLGRDEPRIGWPIASFVTGGLGVAYGGLLTFVFAQDGSVEPGLWAFALVPLAVGITNLSLAIATLVKRSNARAEPELEENDWVVAPLLLDGRAGAAPGIGAAIRF